MDVHRKGGYTFAVQKRRGESDDRRIRGAKKLLHAQRLTGKAMAKSSGETDNGVHGTVNMRDETAHQPHERLAEHLAEDLAAVDLLIREYMSSEHAPRIPEVTAHLIEAGGKRLRPMLTIAAARLMGYDGPYHVYLAATVEFIHTAT